MSALDDFIDEIRCYDENWFDELQGRSAKHELSALRSRIAELEATWQPIETAPHNSEIIIGSDKCVKSYPMWFDGNKWVAPYIFNPNPTHWMPLPKPPEEK